MNNMEEAALEAVRKYNMPQFAQSVLTSLFYCYVGTQ